MPVHIGKAPSTGRLRTTRRHPPNGVSQCGYCQSGMIMAATALLAARPDPSETDIAASMTNICRCGTYPRIKRAILSVANQNGATALDDPPTQTMIAADHQMHSLPPVLSREEEGARSAFSAFPRVRFRETMVDALTNTVEPLSKGRRRFSITAGVGGGAMALGVWRLYRDRDRLSPPPGLMVGATGHASR